ncbi:MAG: hypothetical protein HY712_06340 [candidate division NC10 bacterium]|nr:hypothetical protein [candidate division NC10 bacterium]
MTCRFFAFSLGFALLAGGCAATLENYRAKSPDEAQILVTLMRIPNGISARSVDTILLAYADDAYVGNFNKYLGGIGRSNKTTLRKPDLRMVYGTLFKETKDTSMDVKEFQLSVSGDRAVAEGYLETLVKTEGGRQDRREEVIRNHVLWRLQRTPFGWRIKEEIYQ